MHNNPATPSMRSVPLGAVWVPPVQRGRDRVELMLPAPARALRLARREQPREH